MKLYPAITWFIAWARNGAFVEGWAQKLALKLLRLIPLFALMLFALILYRGYSGVEANWIDEFLGTSGPAAQWGTINSLGQALLALLLTFGIYTTYRISIALKKTTQAHHDSNEQWMFNEATAKLGHELSGVRVGGIYGLYKLASSNEQYLENITEILCAHLRWTTQRRDYQEEHKNKPSNEIQSLLSVLSRLNIQNKKDNKSNPLRLNLSASYLVGANLDGACLNHVNLSGTIMQKASLREVQLQGADLSDIQIQEATLDGAQMQWASLERARMQKASLKGAQMQGAHLREAQMQGTFLHHAQLQGVSLWRAQMQGVSLWGAQMQETILKEANLHGAYSLRPVTEYPSLAEQIRARRGKPTDLTTVIFNGGLTENDVQHIRDELTEYQRNKGMTKKEIDRIDAILVEHQDKPAVKQLPKDSGAITGVLTKEEADKIIAEYEAAMAV